MRWATAVLTMLLALGAAPPSATQILDDGLRRLQSYPVPPYAVWTTTWHIRARPMGYYEGGETSSVAVNRYAVRIADGMENTSEPPLDGKLPPATIGPEFLGPFAWSLRSQIHVAPSDDATAMQPDFSGLKTIATVHVAAKPSYTIGHAPGEPVPIVNVDGRPAYHLELHPVNDPAKHNLRDLWIDVATHDVLEVHFAGRYSPGPGAPSSPTDARAYFRNVLGCWVIVRDVWTYEDSPMLYTFDVQNDEIGLPPTLPDWLFDSAAYLEHERAREPDYLGLLLQRMRTGAQPSG